MKEDQLQKNKLKRMVSSGSQSSAVNPFFRSNGLPHADSFRKQFLIFQLL